MAAAMCRPGKPWSLYPSLHDDVARLLDEEGLCFDFFDIDDAKSNILEQDTNIMGRFFCRTRRCHSNGWQSKKIATTIRLYTGQRYNARVYHQRCRYCNAIAPPVLDDSYAKRVSYWMKKWNGVQVQKPSISGQGGGPHDSALCERCRADHCTNRVALHIDK
ncbi:hypothetical protein BDW75DRAFT_232978 [Aspergillus navahoensis]